MSSIKKMVGSEHSIVCPGDKLTPRERDAMSFVLNGQRLPQIAIAMGVSINTAKFHLKNIYSKLGANSRSAAIAAYNCRFLKV